MEIDYNDPESFKHILPPGFPIPNATSPREVRREADERRANILSYHATLGDILSRHEATIHKRWTKKSKPQRTKILLECWPSMAKHHRPDFSAYREERARKAPSSTSYRESYLYPSINLADLSGPRAFLVFLNARGRNHPSHFACADLEAIHLGLVLTTIVPVFLNEHTMLLSGVEDDRYGKLLSWDDHPDAFEWMHQRKQFQPGEGLLVLQIQERLLRFCVDCCKCMFHDISPADFLSDAQFPVQPMPELKVAEDAVDAHKQMCEEEPYRLPTKLDLKSIAQLLDIKANDAADHFWLLREDPAYFADELSRIRSHRGETIRDTNGGTHPVLGLHRGNEFSARVMLSLLDDAYMSVEEFAELARQAHVVNDLHQKVTDLGPDEDLPSDLLDGILLFRHHLLQVAKRLQDNLAVAVPASPPMRHFYTRVPPMDKGTSVIRMDRNDRQPNESEAHLLFLLTPLFDSGRSLFFFRLPLLMDELDRHIEVVGDLLSPRVKDLLADLSIVAMCLRHLDQYYPWARTFEDKLVERQDDITESYDAWFATLASIRKALEGGKTKLASLTDDHATRFRYPVDKPPSKANVEALRNAERYLDDFWSHTDAVVRKACKNPGKMAFYSVTQRHLQRTEPWVEPAPTPKSNHNGSGVSTLLNPLGDLLIPTPTEPQSTHAPKVKTKTRGIARPNAAAAQGRSDDDATDAESTESTPTIAVDQRALKTFRSCFHDPNASAIQGQVAWKEFRHAMAAAGFPGKITTGSAWQFQGQVKSILLHAPHPAPKMDYQIARLIGRRLTSRFGWTGRTFVLRESNGTTNSG